MNTEREYRKRVSELTKEGLDISQIAETLDCEISYIEFIQSLNQKTQDYLKQHKEGLIELRNEGMTCSQISRLNPNISYSDIYWFFKELT